VDEPGDAWSRPGFEFDPNYPGLPRFPQPQPTDGLAVAALVCGLCGFIYLVPAVLGIIFGSIAVHQTSRNGRRGKGMAVAGIVAGAFWIVAYVLIIAYIVASGFAAWN
jgi:hypothetical protein